MINDASVSNALTWLAENCEEIANARSDKLFMTEYRKTKKSELMNKAPGKTESEKERWAYAHEEYIQMLDKYHDAVWRDVFLSAKSNACEAVLRTWQTQQANIRAAESIR